MEQYWLWLCSHKKLYRQDYKKLIEYFQTPKEIFQASEQELRKFGQLKEEQIKELLESRYQWEEDREAEKLKEKGIRFISGEHPEFPERLKKVSDPPFGLFVKGKLPSNERMTVGIVGARRCSCYGKQMAERLARTLAEQQVQIISGMALGIDGNAQNAAVEAGGESYGVLGSGVDVCYPRFNRSLYEQLPCRGGILSEYPPGREPLALHFPIRNRIISGLSDCLVVIEAKMRSGSLITADLALEQGKDVYAVPGRIGDVLSAGCNYLISQGAGIILSEEEFLKELGIHTMRRKEQKKPRKALKEKEQIVYEYIDLSGKSLHDIIEDCQLSAPEAMSIVTMLLMKDYIKEERKNYYVRKN